jgi:hypothetical protein
MVGENFSSRGLEHLASPFQLLHLFYTKAGSKTIKMAHDKQSFQVLD